MEEISYLYTVYMSINRLLNEKPVDLIQIQNEFFIKVLYNARVVGFFNIASDCRLTHRVERKSTETQNKGREFKS